MARGGAAPRPVRHLWLQGCCSGWERQQRAGQVSCKVAGPAHATSARCQPAAALGAAIGALTEGRGCCGEREQAKCRRVSRSESEPHVADAGGRGLASFRGRRGTCTCASAVRTVLLAHAASLPLTLLSKARPGSRAESTALQYSERRVSEQECWATA